MKQVVLKLLLHQNLRCTIKFIFNELLRRSRLLLYLQICLLFGGTREKFLAMERWWKINWACRILTNDVQYEIELTSRSRPFTLWFPARVPSVRSVQNQPRGPWLGWCIYLSWAPGLHRFCGTTDTRVYTVVPNIGSVDLQYSFLVLILNS